MKISVNLLTLFTVVCLTALGCPAGTPESEAVTRANPDDAPAVPVDPAATPATRDLLQKLHDQKDGGALFGHQHDLSMGFTFDEGDGESSDTLAAVGDYPAVFGWDSLIIDGDEAPGSEDVSPEENVTALSRMFEQADALGGINTLTMHLPNLVTGGDFYDTSGNVVAAVLPDGAKHSELLSRLDRVADAIKGAKRQDGTPIPVILRPWHEQNGSWFWWGAGHATPDQYVELFQFTVKYLRDTRGLHNVLYAYSPNSPLNADPGTYLVGYPGDDYVDVLGYDSYDSAKNSDEWIRSVTDDLAMVARLADERGKVAAWTEFGPYERSNPGPHWFTSVLDPVKGDEDASRIVWMLTWANYGHGDTGKEKEHAYVPYPAHGNYPEHHLLADFRAFHDDPWTIFAADWKPIR